MKRNIRIAGMKKTYYKIIFIAAVLSLACTTKVSEWVMLNSEPDRYMLVYYHKDDISQQVQQQNERIENSFKSANMVFRSVLRDDIKEPYYALLYNNRQFSQFEGYKDLEKLVFSPLREKVASELMNGKLCVMLYLNSGNRDKDERGLQILKNTVAESPFSTIIPVVELDRSSVEESVFVSMLLNVESDLKDIHEPMIFGLFGRFRALEPLLAGGITEENINLMIDFLTADCSCLIKDNLPGISILYDSKWDNPATAMVNAILDANPALIHH
jgi:hypothetical protein